MSEPVTGQAGRSTADETEAVSGRGGAPAPGRHRVCLVTIARKWYRIGFGGPPAHIALLRVLCVSAVGG